MTLRAGGADAQRPISSLVPDRSSEPVILWRLPPAQPLLQLQPDQVHLWRVGLGTEEGILPRLGKVLNEEERARAERFRFPRDRRRYIVSHAALRFVLSRYCRCQPHEIRFQYSPYGKPTLAPPFQSSEATLQFNLSHSDDLALIGLALGRQIGVDIERIRPELAEDRIAERFFSPGEVRSLRSLLATEQPQAFFRCWTCKEAFVKARGQGLSLPLDRFDVSFVQGQPPALLSVADIPGEAQRWSLFTLTPAPGYTAAIAVEGHGWHLETWDWMP